MEVVHRELIESGQPLTTVLWNSLLSAYSACDSNETAFKLFHEMPQTLKNSRTWNTMISACSKAVGHLEEAMELFEQMEQQSYRVDDYTWRSLLSVCAVNSNLEAAQTVHRK